MPYTRCPSCATGFRISASQLSAAAGRVRCGRCGARFDALEALSDEPSALPPRPPSRERRPRPPAEQRSPGPLELRPSEEPEPATREQDHEPQPPETLELRPSEEPEPATREQDHEPQPLGPLALRPSEEPEPAAREQDDEPQPPGPLERRPSEEPEPAARAPDDETGQPAEPQSPGPLKLRPSEEPEPATREQDDPPQEVEPPDRAGARFPFPVDFAEFAASYPDHEDRPQDARRRLRVGIAKGLGILALGVILILQITWFERQQLVYTAAGRSLLNGLCWVADCEPPPRRDLGRFEIESRDILATEQQPGVLHLQLEFANQAGFPQPYPQIRVTLLSQQREPTAQRTFSPGEYMAPSASQSHLVLPQEKVQVSLELMKPETGWTGQYRFEFL